MMYLMARKGAKVRHVAVWAYDRVESSLFVGQGRHVPLCGQRHVDGHWTFTVEGDNRRFCSRCVRAVKEVAELVKATEGSV